MRRFFDPCGGYREQISLLVSEALPREDRAGLENHMSVCAGCRRYHNEIRTVAGSLLRWGDNFASLQPGDAALARWDKDLAAVPGPSRRAPGAVRRRVLVWCKDLLWPSRWLWAGLAAVWAVILVINFSQRGQLRASAAKAVSPSPELVRAFLDGGFPDEPIHPSEKNSESPKPPAPRSEQHSGPVSSQTI